ncbi:hypothetical protein LCGC14_1410120 [marine sediment metagenome]|uniref:Uncharacterized protein n=1 Tax=marine sediment metagenome TaxID=412755 RepID=A0A0F9KFJ5_9ZZZZ
MRKQINNQKADLKHERKTLINEAYTYTRSGDDISADVCYIRISGIDNRLRRAYIDIKLIFGLSLVYIVILTAIIL